MSGWQPIETAPKDDMRVLVSDGRTIWLAYWNTDPRVWEHDVDSCWTVYEADDFFYSRHLVEDDETPTHWMPLPEAPKP